MVNGNLPDGWKWTTLGESFKWGSGGTPLRSNPSYYEGGDIPWVIIGDLNDGVVTDTQTKITKKGLENSSAKWVEEGSVLIAMYGSIGKLGIAGKRLTTNQAIAFTKPESVSTKYLFYYLMGERNNLLNLGAGATQQNISQTVIKAYPFPLAPLPEQERIVSRIEELFSDLEAGVAALERVRAGLRRYKASVLKAAVEGRLLKDESGRMKDEGELPEGWRWIDFKEVMKSLKNGFFYGRPATEPPGIPILRISAVRPLSVNLEELRFIPDIDEEKVKDYFLEKGDLLFTRYNGNMSLVGACGMVRELPKLTVYPDKLIRVKVNHDVILPEYVEIYFSTQTARKFVEGHVKSTAGQHGIAGGDIKSIPVILPPLEEQRRIVAEVERRLSVVKEVESAVEAGLARAARLRQAVLRSAFEGRL